MKVNDLKRNLKDSSKEELIKEIVELFKKNSFVKDYYILKYDSESNSSILDKHKDIIEDEFFPKIGFGKARLSVAKKSITEFKKLSQDKTKLADLMVFYVEIGVKFTNCYGDIDEPFYLSMESMYDKAVQFIISAKLEEMFNHRCLEIVNDTAGMGWGFHDQLNEIYHEYLGEESA
ncbi:MAG: hypothetical protein COB26_04845 [Piscirickettsiaceae bacterium]|nr:MAG: hypothetical protein COB26_04845 [Piscirickettsiaceae bacterium]